MTRTRFALAAMLAGTALALAGCGGNDEESSDTSGGGESATTVAAGGGGGGELTGTVGPGFDISMTGTDGLTPGEYTIKISDKSTDHNFHLTGPGVDEKTEVGEEGDVTWTVTLQSGEYKFMCDPHSSSMNGSFTVG
jgi:plastocyanin